MKKLFFCVMVLSIIASCSTSSVKDKPNMPGTYLMTSQTVNDGTRETKYTDLKQLKIYTDDFMMYVQVNPADSISAFGVGTYTSSDTGTVTENVIYSASDTNFVPRSSTFKLIINKKPDGYEQVIPQIVTDSQNYKLTETYQKVGTAMKTPLDGVWKEVRSYNLRGKDTIKTTRTQYKGFYDGYFMFGHTFIDSTAKKRTGIGFGTFQMINDKKIKETDLNSTYSIIAGNTFDIDIEMTGTDQYKQTLTNADGTIGVEYYERLKK